MLNQSPFVSKIENVLRLKVDIIMNNNKIIIGKIFTLNSKSKIIILVNKKKGKENYNISIINVT